MKISFRIIEISKTFHGCLRRIMNYGVSGNRHLMDKPHCDGSLSRFQSDAPRMSSFGDPVEDRVILSDLSTSSSNKNPMGTPIKLLIAHEMSREMDSKHNSPSLVAKLMGLDALPTEEPESVLQQKSHSKYYVHSGISSSYWQQDDDLDMRMPHDLNNCLEQSEYKDVYEVFNHSHRGNYRRNKSPQEGRQNEIPNEQKMALVREKFTEAKRLATDEKLRQSKRFQDALDVLSTNRDLFIKFLQEPNSLISQHRFDLPSVPPSETKRITVLKPSKLIDSKKLFRSQKNEKQTRKVSDIGQKVGWDQSNLEFSPSNWRSIDNPTQPTRIVVLKPSNGKIQDIKSVVSPPLSPRFLHSDKFLGEPDDDAEKSREVYRHRRDDTLLSSVFSNGYIGDESSFHKSESECVLGNLSDPEVVSPTSRHSWDYIHRVGSPFSCSSFGRASCSPESSVCREAKKRLSERWAVVASSGSYVEQPKHVRRSSSTLGEMLALSDLKSSVLCKEGTSMEQEARDSTSCLINDLNGDENVDNSPINILRSKSVPASTMLGDTLNLQVSNPEDSKTYTPKKLGKSRSLKTSLKGKVSSLFSRSKRSTEKKASACQSNDESNRSCGSTNDFDIRGANGTIKEDGCFHDLQAPDEIFLPYSNRVEAQCQIIFSEAGLSAAKPKWLGNSKDNENEPSPVSVLEQLFEEDDNLTSGPCNVKPTCHGAILLGHSLRSNLIDKSPPIGSISRTLSRDNSYIDKRTDYMTPPSPPIPCKTGEGEQGWHFYAQSLLSAIGLSDRARSNSYIARWHSPDSPLDPSLRGRYIDLNEKEITHEGKRRRMRSTKKLVFDCVNTILGDIKKESNNIGENILEFDLADHVWARMRELFSDEVRCDDVDGNSLVVERVVRKEVVGMGWVEQIKMEMDNIRKDIEENLLEEIVHESIVEFSGGLKIFG